MVDAGVDSCQVGENLAGSVERRIFLTEKTSKRSTRLLSDLGCGLVETRSKRQSDARNFLRKNEVSTF
jgi:hypothetical protein